MQENPKINIFNNPARINDLEIVRNKYALRIQKGIAQYIVKHKNARAIYLYLELKPLFNSGVIFADGGKLPYKKIADFIKEDISGIRAKIKTLKKLGLVYFDKKNICLVSIKKLPLVLKLTKDENFYNKKHYLKNNSKAQFTVKQLAIYENLKKQEFVLFRKIYLKELSNEYFELNKLDNKNSNKNFYLTCERFFSKAFLKKFKKSIRNNYDALKKKYQTIFDIQILQIQQGEINLTYPEINTNVTLSYNGVSRIMGRTSKYSGRYQLGQLVKFGYIEVWGGYKKVSICPAIQEQDIYGVRSDMFSYRYPTKKTSSGLIRKYFRNCTNELQTVDNAIFF